MSKMGSFWCQVEKRTRASLVQDLWLEYQSKIFNRSHDDCWNRTLWSRIFWYDVRSTSWHRLENSVRDETVKEEKKSERLERPELEESFFISDPIRLQRRHFSLKDFLTHFARGKTQNLMNLSHQRFRDREVTVLKFLSKFRSVQISNLA